MKINVYACYLYVYSPLLNFLYPLTSFHVTAAFLDSYLCHVIDNQPVIFNYQLSINKLWL